MRPSTIRYYFRESFIGLLKNRLMTVASIATVAACIFIIAFSYCIVNNLQYVLRQMEDSIGVVVFLNDDLTNEQIVEMSDTLNAIPHITHVSYISPQEALEKMKKDYDMGEALDGFDNETNPISHSFEISLEGIEYQKDVISELENLKNEGYLSNVRHAQSETEILLKINNVIKVSGIIIIGVLSIISVVIIMNTIKISVYTRRNEINIMKYVGATDWFIRWPFIIEGILIGIIGAAIPMIISWPLYNRIIKAIYTTLPFIEKMVVFRYSSEIFSTLLPISFCSGALIGIIGSVTSIRKHLQV